MTYDFFSGIPARAHIESANLRHLNDCQFALVIQQYRLMEIVMRHTLVMTLLAIGTVLSACGWGRAEITNYDECVAAGHPQLESYPGQCVMPDGTRFVQAMPDPPAICKDECGNGDCQAMVCLGSGCPCAESEESCPADCAAP